MNNRPDFRYLIKYGKEPAVRFISHLDLIRTWERILRRADLPLAYTEGYNPRVKLSFGQPLSLGFTSQAEYLELYLKQLLPTRRLYEKLAAAGLAALPILEVATLPAHWPSIMAATRKNTYQVGLTGEATTPAQVRSIQQRLTEFLDSPRLVVQRQRKLGPQEIDLRPYLESLELISEPEPYLLMTLLIKDTSINPRDVLKLMPELKHGQVCRVSQQLAK